MIEQIFTDIPQTCQPGPKDEPVTIYFSIGDIKKTVQMSPSGCQVDNGKVVEDADCVCKTSEEFFLKVWNDGYKPGLKDFLSGAIKSNKPDILATFLSACGKS